MFTGQVSGDSGFAGILFGYVELFELATGVTPSSRVRVKVQRKDSMINQNKSSAL